MATWSNESKSNTTQENVGKTGQARWDDIIATWDSVLESWDGIATAWVNRGRGSNSVAILTEYGEVLLTEDGEVLLTEVTNADVWTNEIKN